MFEISAGKIAKAQKVVIYGVEGVGKSTFASQFPDPLFIDVEGSTNNMNVKRMTPPTSWTMLLSQIDWVKTNKPCKTLVIDTADWTEEYLCKPHVLATVPHSKGYYVKNIEDYGYGAGYKHLGEIWGKDLLNKLQDLVDSGINVVITAHAQLRKFDQPDELGQYDRWELKLEKKTAALTKEWADLLLFANFKSEIMTDGEGYNKKNKVMGSSRKMYADHHAAWDAKNRHNLPEMMEFDYKNIAHIFAEAEQMHEQTEEVKLPEEKPITTTEQTEKSKVKQKAMERRYFYHSESDSTILINPGDELPDENEGLEEITEGHYIEKEFETLRIVTEEYNNLPSDKYSEQDKKKIAEMASQIKEKHPNTPWTKAFEEARNAIAEKQQIPPLDNQLVSNKALNDLMAINHVTTDELQKVVASKGYYPPDTPIENYDEGFVQGVLVGAWDQVYKMIEELRK